MCVMIVLFVGRAFKQAYTEIIKTFAVKVFNSNLRLDVRIVFRNQVYQQLCVVCVNRKNMIGVTNIAAHIHFAPPLVKLRRKFNKRKSEYFIFVIRNKKRAQVFVEIALSQ